jgi:8-oxo-dGTP pyrophosphatase MutT (NUDIX family)
MRKAVRAIVVKDGALLTMHRNKFGHEYYTLVGGGLKPHEHDEQALAREVLEESGVRIINPRLVFIEPAGDPFGDQYIYYCDYHSGDLGLHPESIEAKINEHKQNMYTPHWLPLEDLPNAPFLTENLKKHILDSLNHGFAGHPITLQKTA